MRDLLCLLCLLWLNLPASAQPAVVLLLDSRRPSQTQITVRTKDLLQRLREANQPGASQLVIRSVDFAQPSQARQWRQHGIHSEALPAAVVMNGAQPETIRLRATQPKETAEWAFIHLQARHPDLIKQPRILTLLRVDSLPPGARVLLNGEERGLTPLEVAIEPKPQRLELQHPHCFPLQREIRPQLGKILVQEYQLSVRKAFVRFESSLPEGELELETESRLLPCVVEMPSGEQEFQIKTAGHYPVKGNLHVIPDRLNSVKVSPLPIRLRVGLDSFEARGYQGFRDSGFFFNFVETYQILLPEGELADRLHQGLLPLPFLDLDSSDSDLRLRVTLLSSRQEVLGELILLDRAGKVLDRFQTTKGMPFLTLDEEGSAHHRAREVIDEMLVFLKEKLPALQALSETPPPDAPSQFVVETSD